MQANIKKTRQFELVKKIVANFEDQYHGQNNIFFSFFPSFLLHTQHEF